jgi:hypothetical protein
MINDYSIALSGQAAVDEITVTCHAPFWGANYAPPILAGLAYLCRKFAIFGGRESHKSLLQKGLKIYGIFGNSKIVQSQ